MVKANHLPRYVKGTIRNTSSVVGNFEAAPATAMGGLFLDPYGSTWNRVLNIKWCKYNQL